MKVHASARLATPWQTWPPRSGRAPRGSRGSVALMRRSWSPASSALTVLGVALALVVIGAAAAAGPLSGHGGSTQEAVDVGLVVLCIVAVAAGLGASIVTRAGRSEVRAARRSTPGPSLGLAIAAIFAGAVVAVLTTMVHSRKPSLGEVVPDPSGLERGGGNAAGGAGPWLVFGLLALAAIALAASLLWLRRALAERRAGGVGLAGVARQARRALALPDDDRTAVLLAYARMEELLAGRRAVEAPREFLQRATAASGAEARVAATRLTALFERARFDRSAVSPRDRAEADAALDVLGRGP
jgi:Domain of unknown function (DUF4129)